MALISFAFQASIFATVFGYGLHADRGDLVYLFRRPRLFVLSLLAIFIVMPVVALAMEVYLDFPHAARVGLVVIALSPIPQLLPKELVSGGGRSSYAFGLALAMALMSIVLTPFLVHFIGRLMNRPFAVGTGTIAEVLIPTVIVPLALGLVVQAVVPRFAARVAPPTLAVANVILLVALVALLSLVIGSVFEVFTLRALLAMIVFVAAGLAIGHVMAGPEPDDSMVLAIACSKRNPGIAIAIATQNFPEESFAPTVIMYALVAGVLSTQYVNWVKRRMPAAAPRPAIEPM
jgi:BASS family bile acid:Na+ symporter